MRAPCVDRNGMKKGAWSEEEDNKLRAYILRYGHWNWRLLPKFAGLARCGKSCRLRWVNYLKPGVKRGNYSMEEELITKLHDQLGNKWSAIAAKLPGRTDNEIKNHWHTHLKKRSKSFPAAPTSSQTSLCNNSQEAASTTCGGGRDVNYEALNLQAPDIPILESSGSEYSWNRFPINWDSDDGASSACSAQQVQTSFLASQDQPAAAETCYIPTEFFQDRSDQGASSSPDSFESFWTQPFLVDCSYGRDESFSPLEEGAFFSGYLFE